MGEHIQTSAITIRLLFLGCFETDRRIKSFARFFSRSGFHVEILFGEPGQNEFRTWKDDTITITQIPLRRASGPLMFLEYRRKLSKQLSSLPKSQITFACDLYSLSTARRVKLRGQTDKVLYDARELYTELPTVASKPLVKLFWKVSEKRGLMSTDRVIVTAPLDADAIMSVHGFLPHSVLVRNLPEPSLELQKSNYLRELYPIGDRTILVYAGGIQKDRGLQEMIKAMKELRHEYAFVMIGDGSLRPVLEEKVKADTLGSSVYFHGSVHSDELHPILTSANIGITLINTNSVSYELALPSKVFEYFQAGLLVLSSNMKQVIDLFPNEKMIKFVDSTTEGIFEGLKELSPLISNPEASQEISRRINSSFTFDGDAHSLLSFLNS
ncbi:MAG TPA: glycosyltransferase [Candidatus Kapabacteria bacterium]